VGTKLGTVKRCDVSPARLNHGSYVPPQLELRPLSSIDRRSAWAVETGGLEKLNRRFAISLKIQLNPFASRKIALISVFWSLLFFACFAPVLVTIWWQSFFLASRALECHTLKAKARSGSYISLLSASPKRRMRGHCSLVIIGQAVMGRHLYPSRIKLQVPPNKQSLTNPRSKLSRRVTGL
jgi:hypothetical protein